MKVDVDWFYVKEDDDAQTIDLLGVDPVPALSYYAESKNAAMRRCPAHLDALKNTYVVLSPIDCTVSINKTEQWLNVEHPPQFPPQFVNPRFTEEGDSPFPIFSLSFGAMVFNSRKHDVWMEQVQPYLEWEHPNPIRVIGGIFNIHRWVRPVEVAFEQRSPNIRVEIKRGQPLYYIKFTTGNPSDIVSLRKIEPSSVDVADYKRNVTLKKVCPMKSLAFMYGLRDKLLQRLKVKL